jgi:hypothetical protein
VLVAPQLEIGLVDGEHAMLFEKIAGRAQARGDDTRARRAYALARDVWATLQRLDRVAIVEARLASLEPPPALANDASF